MDYTNDFLNGFDPMPEGITLPDRILLAYEPVSCLAHRENRSVWKLRRRADGALFVLKVVSVDEENLMEEFRILNQLVPVLPGAVPYPIDCFQSESTTYLLRSFLPGETLTQYRDRTGTCSAQTCAELGRKLCDLLKILHTQEPPVVHRDIKPENIILLPNGQVGLIDFGIARQYKDQQDTDTRHLGTRTTAAPEQYGYSQTDQRTDLYAVGITLIWLLTGEYDQSALKDGAGIPRHLIRALRRAASFDPSTRFSDAAALEHALRPRKALKRTITATVLCCILGLLALAAKNMPTPPPPEEQVIEFTSQQLEDAVRLELNRPDGEIIYGDLEQIEHLGIVSQVPFTAETSFDYRIGTHVGGTFYKDAPVGDVSDLSLLAYMPNLKEVYLCQQNITDLTPLEGLPLKTLALCDTPVTDLSPIAELTELETLYLAGNAATDHSTLVSLKSLQKLNLDCTTADDLEFLTSLQLSELSLGLTVPRDGDWSALSTQTQLETLTLWSPNRKTLDVLDDLPKLSRLSIGGWLYEDLSALGELPGLRVFNAYSGVEDLTGIDGMPNLLTLSVCHASALELDMLVGLRQLDFLDLESCEINSFAPLSRLPALTILRIEPEQRVLVEEQCPGHTFQIQE